jgi:hypothetical protein
MAELQLISIELRFKTREEPGPLTDRIRESVAMIVGREALEEFRWRGLPLESAERRPRRPS